MAQFKAFQEGVMVNGQTILSVVNALATGQDQRLELLKKHNLDPEVDKWYSQQSWLNAFEEIATQIGENTLFMIGKAIPENAKFPPEIDNLEAALKSIDVAYHMNHKGGEIGHYKLTEFDHTKKRAVMVCKNPYPSDFDRGIITTMLRKFKPDGSFKTDVVLDSSQESRKKDGESCTYIITW